MKTWIELRAEAHDDFRRVVQVIVKIFFHGLLVLIWFLLDRLVGQLLHKFEAHDAHDYVILIFRWLASFVILVLAAGPALADVIEVAAALSEFGYNRFKFVCKLCPYKQEDVEDRGE